MKIQPDLITLNDDFAGRLASQKSVFDVDDDTVLRSKAKVMPSYTNLSRLDRLKASGKAVVDDGGSGDESSDDDDAGGQGVVAGVSASGDATTAPNGEKKPRRRQRGKGKSLAR